MLQSSTSLYPCSTETALLRPKVHKATYLRGDKYRQHGQVTSIVQWVSKLNSPLWDEVIVTTLLSRGWSLGVLFLVRPDTMLISLIRLSSNRNTDSFSWSATRQPQSCTYDRNSKAWVSQAEIFILYCIFTFPSQQNRGQGFFRLMLDDKTTSKFSSMFKRWHRCFLLVMQSGS